MVAKDSDLFSNPHTKGNLKRGREAWDKYGSFVPDAYSLCDG
jgi:hypothetical protein